ncbi:MAG: flippase-like domain-containing protein [Candidatus Thermoplasmatota archaeon]|nr:flippase-like domain-containing protein [Candidatus Thermoplasmatota archaeon]
MKEKSKERIKTVLKIMVSVGLISYIIYNAGPYKIWSHIQRTNKIFFFIVLLMAIVKVAISAKKWQILLKAKDEINNFFYVWKVYYIGTFFNMFLPTNVGGDVVKAHKMSKVSENTIEAYSSVFMERFTGIIAILSLATVSTTFYLSELPFEIILTIYGVFLPLIVISFIMISTKRSVRLLRGLFEKVFSRFNPFSIKEKLIKLLRSINLYTKKKKALGYSIFISFIFHTLLILSNYILALSIGLDISLHYFFIFIPISAILLFLPISIRGFGVREVLYVYFFTPVGATAAQAVSLSFLVQLVSIISSLIGGSVYLASQRENV